MVFHWQPVNTDRTLDTGKIGTKAFQSAMIRMFGQMPITLTTESCDKLDAMATAIGKDSKFREKESYDNIYQQLYYLIVENREIIVDVRE